MSRHQGQRGHCRNCGGVGHYQNTCDQPQQPQKIKVRFSRSDFAKKLWQDPAYRAKHAARRHGPASAESNAKRSATYAKKREIRLANDPFAIALKALLVYVEQRSEVGTLPNDLAIHVGRLAKEKRLL